MEKGGVINKDDHTIHHMQRQIMMMQQELEQERRINNENQEEMRRLEQDILAISENGSKRECDLQNKLDEMYILHRN